MQCTTTIRENRDFRRAYAKGKSYVDPVLVTYLRKNHMACNRIGLTATKKVGKACKRNRARRLMREAYRQLEPTLETGWDIVFVARAKTCDVKMQDVLRAMRRHLKGIQTPPHA